MSEDQFFLYDDQEETNTRFVSFMGENHRYDLAIMTTDRYYGKKIVIDLQGSHYAIIGQDDVEEPGYLEHVYNLTEVEAEELREFLRQVI
ncbi:DUF3055 domain-containing protein [Pontibacillus marinus]|uniref:Cytosolic protein n=1 Tax=Pontibacillus marinus BH030004 = DSM 16465 TaxID=1385511 RepID=A0A0A5GF90_9BACI|nr:DUF3055 domain-containing protein [Pontibacillus marinus]KGX89790.1 hypothetical protein N783_04120 [Pontibacillus marinus BH030004 = DSM 16465]